ENFDSVSGSLIKLRWDVERGMTQVQLEYQRTVTHTAQISRSLSFFLSVFSPFASPGEEQHDIITRLGKNYTTSWNCCTIYSPFNTHTHTYTHTHTHTHTHTTTQAQRL